MPSPGYALYHDIGHPAFSHVTENLCVRPKGAPRGMSMNGALSYACMQKLRPRIQKCGIDFSLLEKIASHRNPLAAAVSDKNLGMEKLDYLERDGFFTILSRPVGVDYLRQHIYFIDGSLAIDEKAVDNAIEIQNYYLKIYKNVYLRKASAIAQRMIQKMTHRLIAMRELRREELPNITDSGSRACCISRRIPSSAKCMRSKGGATFFAKQSFSDRKNSPAARSPERSPSRRSA